MEKSEFINRSILDWEKLIKLRNRLKGQAGKLYTSQFQEEQQGKVYLKESAEFKRREKIR